MNKDNYVLLENLYIEYNKVAKPLLATVEALYESHPLQLFNEIRSFNDHIARCFRNDIDESYKKEQLVKARGHLKRTIFDCFKFLNISYNDSVNKFEQDTKRIDLTTIDNGDFWIKYRRLAQDVKDTVREAKKLETINIDQSFDLFQEAFNKYNEIIDFISQNSTKIMWAKSKFSLGSIGKIILFIIGTLISGIISSTIAEHYGTTLLDAFLSLH